MNDDRRLLIEEIQLKAAIDEIEESEAFICILSELLNEVDLINYEIEAEYFETIGSKSKKVQLNGYLYEKNEETVKLFIIPPIGFSKEGLLYKKDLEVYFGRLLGFLENLSYIIKNGEESCRGIDIAREIIKLKKHNKIKKIVLNIVTDQENVSKTKFSMKEKIDNIDVDYVIWDLKEIKKLKESNGEKEVIKIDIKSMTDGKGIPCLFTGGTLEYESYLASVSGDILANLYNEYGGRLLENNVRSFLQIRGKVNKGIRNTILNEPNFFFAYNNGITATAYNIKTEVIDGVQSITELEGFQIVNGGQTTVSLATAWYKDEKDNSHEKIKRICVPMKLSVVSKEKEEFLVPQIARYANSQNKVSESDLWSNHSFHIRLEDYSRRIPAPPKSGENKGSKWYYERVKGQYRQETYKKSKAEKNKFEAEYPKKQVITKTDLAKHYNIFDQKPHIASKGGQSSFAIFAKKISKMWDKNDLAFNEDFYRKMVAKAIIFKECDKLVKKSEWYNSYKANIVAYTISFIMYKISKEYKGYSFNFSNVWRNQELSAATERQLQYTSKIIYEFLISDDREFENVTEWAKRENCWKKAQNLKIDFFEDFVNEFSSYKEVKEEVKEAKNNQKENNKCNKLIAVYNYGECSWEKLIKWEEEHDVLNIVERNKLKSILLSMKDGNITDKQVEAIYGTLQYCREEGFPY